MDHHSLPRRPAGCDHSVVRDCDVAQAAELIRALKQQLHEMTARLARVERQGVAMQLEADALRRDIQEAQVLIGRLQRRYYLSGDESTKPAGRLPLAMVGPASQVTGPTFRQAARERNGQR
jgi:Tfp pilus assembly protein PilO